MPLQPSEFKPFTFDFGPDMAPTEVITSIVSVTTDPVTGLTLGTPVISGQKVITQMSGTAGLYKNTCIVLTDLPQRLECDGYLEVAAG